MVTHTDQFRPYSNGPRAIETEYAGCRFRSRLEARWAVFFDALGIEWEHEPEGFETSAGRYLPDFRIQVPDSGELWFEVKPPGAPTDTRHQAFSERHTLLVARGMPRDYWDQLHGSRSALQAWGGIQVGWHTHGWGSESLSLPAAFVGDFAQRIGPTGGWPKLTESWRWHSDVPPHRVHVAILNLHEGGHIEGGPPPWWSVDIDAAYARARSERFGT